jgi:hypothetical protein
MLPELLGEPLQGENILNKEFSSVDNALSLENTIALLKKHRLMVEDVQNGTEAELLR